MLLGGLAYPNNGPTETLESDFLPTDDAVVLYTFLDQMKPLPANSNLYYKLYRDAQCTAGSHLTFMHSMQKFGALGIQSGMTFFVVKDTVPHF